MCLVYFFSENWQSHLLTWGAAFFFQTLWLNQHHSICFRSCFDIVELLTYHIWWLYLKVYNNYTYIYVSYMYLLLHNTCTYIINTYIYTYLVTLCCFQTASSKIIGFEVLVLIWPWFVHPAANIGRSGGMILVAYLTYRRIRCVFRCTYGHNIIYWCFVKKYIHISLFVYNVQQTLVILS